MILRGEPGSPERLAQVRGDENAERIERAKTLSEQSQAASAGVRKDAQLATAYALQGLLEIAIVRADVRSYEPPF